VAATDALSNRNRGLVFEVGSQTVGEYLERWLQTSAKGSVRDSTYESYRQQVRRYMIPAIGRVKLTMLSAMHVQGMYRAMPDRGLSPRTVQYTLAVLHRALKQAVRWGADPAQRLRGCRPAAAAAGRDAPAKPCRGAPPAEGRGRLGRPLRGTVRPRRTAWACGRVSYSD
jgi:hypothetical protein